MQFRTYPKIHRLGKEETDGILEGEVVVQEKVDGANISIWLGDNGQICCGSRTRELEDGFNGFVDYVKSNPAIEDWLRKHPSKRLYGEWLVKHTITYPDSAYKKIYLYDIYDDEEDFYASQEWVAKVAAEIGVEYPQVFMIGVDIKESDIKEVVGKTMIPEAANGEGVVIKHFGFKDKWGNHCYAKMVHEQFKEANAIVFGGNNKHSETYWEMYVVNKYCTTSRVRKIMQKLQPEIDRRLDMEHIPEVAGRCYHDLITEEAWEIVNKVPALDLKKLRQLCNKKFIQIYKDLLNNSLSVADSEVENE